MYICTPTCMCIIHLSLSPSLSLYPSSNILRNNDNKGHKI